MNTKLKWIFSLIGVVAVAGITVGGYFGLRNSKYSNFYLNPISNDTAGLIGAYKGALIKGAELILTPGFNHADPIVSTFDAHSDEFSNVGFLLYDSVVAENSRAAYNTWNIQYRTDLGSIQVGIAIAYFLNIYQDVFLGDDGKLTWACWGGLPFSSVTSFMGGVQQGIKWANKNWAGKQVSEGKNYIPVQQVFAKSGNEIVGGFDPTSGIGTMLEIISQEPDALMPVGGPQVWTAQDEIIKRGSKTILIGVDSAVEDDKRNRPLKFKDANGNKIGNGKIIQFSSLKKLDESTISALEIINNGNKIPRTDVKYKGFSKEGKEGDFAGFGTIAVGNTENNLVGISEAGRVYFEKGLDGQADPSNDPKYNVLSNMVYDGIKEDFKYDDLRQQPSVNVSNVNKVLNKEGIIKKDNQSDTKKIQMILSEVGSELMDGSFSQSCYTGLYLYYKSMGIEIPPPLGVKG